MATVATIGAGGVAVAVHMESQIRPLSTIKLLADLDRRFREERPGLTLAIQVEAHRLLAAVRRYQATLREISILTAAGATFESKTLSSAEVSLDGQRTAEVLH